MMMTRSRPDRIDDEKVVARGKKTIDLDRRAVGWTAVDTTAGAPVTTNDTTGGSGLARPRELLYAAICSAVDLGI